MAITVDPSKMLNRLAPKNTVERLVTQKLTLNRAVLTTLSHHQEFLSKSTMEEIAVKVIQGYKKRYENELDLGETKKDAFSAAVNKSKKMVQRVQDGIIYEVSSKIKNSYHGQYYIWLPSDADEPDPLHQLNYGKRFRIGRGEMPGERYGCRCGLKILTEETQLNLE